MSSDAQLPIVGAKARSVWMIRRLKNGDYHVMHAVLGVLGSLVEVRLPSDCRFTRAERAELRASAHACARQRAENDSELGHA